MTRPENNATCEQNETSHACEGSNEVPMPPRLPHIQPFRRRCARVPTHHDAVNWLIARSSDDAAYAKQQSREKKREERQAILTYVHGYRDRENDGDGAEDWQNDIQTSNRLLMLLDGGSCGER